MVNLASKRRAALRFVPALRTDDEWVAETRRAAAGVLVANKSIDTNDAAIGHADFYRSLARSGTSTPTIPNNDASSSSLPSRPSTSKVTLEHLDMVITGNGTAEAPLELDGDEDNDEDMSTSVLDTDNVLPAAAEPEDRFCLVCQVIVPAADVPRHTSSVLHNLNKNPQHTVAQPLIPPTYYALRSNNVGYAMLTKLGWTEDSGLGAAGTGRKAPIRAVEKFDRKGVGVEVRRGKHLAKTRVVAKPLAKNKREMLRAKESEMRQFKAGLAYLNS